MPLRAAGVLIDSFIFVPIGAVMAPFGSSFVATSIEAALLFVYLVPQIAVWGMTVGSRCVGVRVINKTGQPPGWARSVARGATPVVVGLVLYPIAARLARHSTRPVCVVNAGHTVCTTPVWHPSGGAVIGVLLVVVTHLVVVYGPAFLDDQRRTLPDRVAGTLVLYRHLPPA
jgi:uncharacterized RDD family membrane protein YckC